MKLFIVRVFVLVIRMLYAPMKLRKTKDKIVWLSRQSDTKSQDMEMLSAAISEISPDTKQVFRLKKLKDQTGITLSYIFSVFISTAIRQNLPFFFFFFTFSLPVNSLFPVLFFQAGVFFLFCLKYCIFFPIHIFFGVFFDILSLL